MAMATAELRLGLRQGSCDMGWGAGLGRERHLYCVSCLEKIL